MLAEYSNPTLVNTPARKYIYAGDRRIAMIDEPGNLFFYLNDHLGSARVVVNAQTGQVADFHWYYAYGAPLGEQTSTGQAYKYTGKPFDDEGGFDLYYYGARYYDPEIGMFRAVDPHANNYSFSSPYAYVSNNPLTYIDPTGMDTLHYDRAGKLQNTVKAEGMNVVYVNGVRLVDQRARETMVTQAENASPFNETGGIVATVAATGEQKAIPAIDGPSAPLPESDAAHVNVFNVANKDDLRDCKGDEIATYHSHPSGSKTIVESTALGIRTKTYSFHQEPSKGDIATAGSTVNYVLSKKNNTVYIYNSSGVITSFPMDLFKLVGK